MEMLKEIVQQEIDTKASSLHDLSKVLWSNPELNFQERIAHKTITDFLENEGFTVERQTPIETAFIATYGTDVGPQIGILCEYDALPGIGHACGHNLIAEAGVAAGLGLKAALSADGAPSHGKVIVYGTPAEEGGGGKVVMMKKGSFDSLDVCMMVHPCPVDVELEDPYLISIEQLDIIYTGKAAHASAAPWEGINALDAAVLCYDSISMLRQQMKPDCRIHGIFTDGGVKPNIIPKRSALSYYIRAPTDNERAHLRTKVMACAQGAAEATGCKVEFVHGERPYSNLHSNLTLRNLYVTNLETTGYKKRLMKDLNVRGSTDAGNVSLVKPLIQPFFSIPANAMLHTEQFTHAAGAESAQLPTIQVGKAMAMAGIDVLCNPEILKKIKQEFESRKD